MIKRRPSMPREKSPRAFPAGFPYLQLWCRPGVSLGASPPVLAAEERHKGATQPLWTTHPCSVRQRRPTFLCQQFLNISSQQRKESKFPGNLLIPGATRLSLSLSFSSVFQIRTGSYQLFQVRLLPKPEEIKSLEGL